MTTVYPATPDDIAVIVDLLEDVERFYGATEFDPWEQRAAEAREALFNDPPAGYTLLAAVAGQAAGLAAYSYLWPAAGTSRSLFLKELFVRESHRGYGVGRALMGAVFDVASKTNCTRVEWQADTDNPISQRFYKLLGVPTHPGKIFYRVQTSDIPSLLNR